MMRFLALALLTALSGCATQYFRDAGAAPPPASVTLETWPHRDLWVGVVFNGEKIGFTRFTIGKQAGSDQYEIHSEASFVLRFLGISKKVQLKSHDVIAPDLTLADFAYEYRIDDSELLVSGRRRDGELTATIVTGGTPNEQRLKVDGKLYPSSVIALYPVLHGLEIGREHSYLVYSGETQTVADVTQRVVGYERSEVFTGNAFKVETAMHGQNVTTWIGADGRPVFELAMRGVMISYLEDAVVATRYLALASLNKKESLLEYSLVRPDRAIANPRTVAGLRVALSGADRMPPSDDWQRCVAQRKETTCAIGRSAGARAAPGAEAAAEALRERYPDAIARHRLQREITATVVTNNLVNRVGIMFIHEVREKTGMPADVIARAFLAARDILGVRDLWLEIEARSHLIAVDMKPLGGNVDVDPALTVRNCEPGLGAQEGLVLLADLVRP